MLPQQKYSTMVRLSRWKLFEQSMFVHVLIYVHSCVCVCIYRSCSKSSYPHLEWRTIAEHFCCGKTQPLLIRLEKSELIFLVFLEVIVCGHNKNNQLCSPFSVRLSIYWKTHVYIVVYMYVCIYIYIYVCMLCVYMYKYILVMCVCVYVYIRAGLSVLISGKNYFTYDKHLKQNISDDIFEIWSHRTKCNI